MRAFYFLIALQELKNPAPDGIQQVDRYSDTLLAIENIATEKVQHIGSGDCRWMERFVEDPKRLLVRVKAGSIHQLALSRTAVVDDGHAVPRQAPHLFPHSYNSVFIMPSTCEFSFIDQDGRIMVIRVHDAPIGKKRLQPYYQTKSKRDLDEALQKGKIIFSIPKEGTDLQGRPLNGIYIDSDWQLEAKARKALPADSEKDVFEHLTTRPY